ncbi:MAG: TROVE domain-containing protein [Spirochaetes bacterium]|nr:TROVE domain-containing protein [Spirochaetota bacterium]
MSKFNERTSSSGNCINHEGSSAYKLNPQLELYNLAAASLLEDTFYENSTQQIERLRKLIRQNDPEYVCRLAIYAREKMYLRSIPLVLLVELAKNKKAAKLAPVLSRVIQRADEITEVLAYYQTANERNSVKKLNGLSKQIQKGIAEAFNKFDEYQFAKYNGNRNRTVSLKDALFLSHPKAKNDIQQLIFNKIADGTLAVPYTWEVKLSTEGNTDKSWEELIDSGKVGYMALLKNLRNILTAGVSDRHLTAVAETISDRKNVLKSKQLPMRFYSAYREIIEIEGSGILIEALEKAVISSIENIEFFKNNKVLIASDVSGSMMKNVSKKSKIQYYDIGLLLSLLLKNKSNTDITAGIFGDTWKVKNLPRGNVLANVDYLKKIEGEVGYSTNGYKVIKWALNEAGTGFDKIIFFTDCQMYNSQGDKNIMNYWKRYKAKYPGSKIYFFNLSGYASAPLEIDNNGVFMISGWNEKIFTMLQSIENGEGLISEIAKIQLKE